MNRILNDEDLTSFIFLEPVLSSTIAIDDMIMLLF
jgi:hypothetical protein